MIPEDILGKVRADPARPRVHFCPTAGWMNDPNGTVYHRGFYHLFYQWNPYADTWGNIHWGHARSRNLVEWEHLPMALSPDTDLAEEHCFSGCLVLVEKQPPFILYTSIGSLMDIYSGSKQCAAWGDDDLIIWRKHPGNPIITQEIHGMHQVLEWRDPYVFVDEGRIFLILGGKLTPTDGGEAVVLLYEALQGDLGAWNFRGILFRHPDTQLRSIECANMFESGGWWVLLLSTYGPVEAFIGDFDPDKGIFIPKSRSFLDGSEDFYATNLLQDKQGRIICFGWVRGFPLGRGWNGCLSIPRVLWVDERSNLRQMPVQELDLLHRERIHIENILVRTYSPQRIQSDAADICVTVTGDSDSTITLRLIPERSESATVEITSTSGEVRVNDCTTPCPRSAGEPLEVRLLLDRSVVEVFFNRSAHLTKVIPTIATPWRLEISSDNPASMLDNLDIWMN